MNRFFAFGIPAAFSTALLLGCTEESKIEKKTVIETPEGKTTIKTEQEIEKSGDNPPAVPTP